MTASKHRPIQTASIFDRRGRWTRRTVAATTTSRPRLDAHQVKALPTDAEAFTVIVETGAGRRRITVRRTPTHNHGYRLDWLCPSCGRPARFLYGWPLACRRCAGLAYPSSQAHHDQAAQPAVTRKLAAIATRLGTTPDATFAPARPPGMHWRTYFDLLVQWWMLHELNEALLTHLLCGGLAGSWYEEMGIERQTVKQALTVAQQVREWRGVQRSRRWAKIKPDRL